jgi:Sigma-70, region 4
MRQVREILQLKFVGDVSIREIARRAGVAASTVRTTIKRFQAAGLTWPLSEAMTDTALEARLFATAGIKQGHRRQAEPDWAEIHCGWPLPFPASASRCRKRLFLNPQNRFPCAAAIPRSVCLIGVSIGHEVQRSK